MLLITLIPGTSNKAFLAFIIQAVNGHFFTEDILKNLLSYFDLIKTFFHRQLAVIISVKYLFLQRMKWLTKSYTILNSIA